ncbi:MAG: hypothetical protein N2D54_05995, partial [Chloroflexota bacterium]
MSISNNLGWDKFTAKILPVLWAILILGLPYNNFPYFPNSIGGKAVVKPFVMYPIFLMLLVYFIPRIIKGKSPKAWIPLFVFVFVALASSGFALFQGVENFRGFTPADRLIRSIVTLGIGVALFLLVSILPNSKQWLRSTVKILYISFLIAFVLGILQ